jgi:hypothetical protein
VTRILQFIAYLAVLVVIALAVLNPRWVFGADELHQSEGVIAESVDLLELNHHFDTEGRQVFAQLCFYDWSDELQRYDCIAFRMVSSGNLWPQRNWAKGGYYVVWNDYEILRRVDAKAFIETWSQEGTNAPDPEIAAREFTPKHHRRELKPPRELKRGPLRLNPAQEVEQR